MTDSVKAMPSTSELIDRESSLCWRCKQNVEFTNQDINDDENVLCVNRIAARTCNSINKAFELFYKRFFPLSMAICMRWLPTREDAEEAADDVFLAVYFKKSQIRSSIRGYVTHASTRRAISKYRQERRHLHKHESIVDEYTETQTRQDNPDLEFYPAFYAFYAQATPADQALMDAKLDGLTYKQIAKQLGTKEVALRVHVWRMKREFFKFLDSGATDRSSRTK
jgi:RNA polymerase sigma factor (sigma-70 family)